MSEKGAEPTPTDNQPADNSHSDHADAMEVDHNNDCEIDCEVHDCEVDHEDCGQDRAQFEGEKSTLREATPDHDDERNSSRKAFLERPSRALLEGEKSTLKEPTPGQPRDEDSYEGQSYHLVMKSPVRSNEMGDDPSYAMCLGLDKGLSQPWGPEPEDGGQRCQDKVAPPTVNEEDAE